MNRHAWRIALTVVSIAALGVTGWSLYAVGRHYDAPKLVAFAAFAVFDGTAYACLHLASEASAAGRSAVGARLASLGMAGASIYLNRFHSDLIDGGRPAALLFSAPTLALLAVSELSWAGPRAKARAEQRGEQPFRFPLFGGWAWIIAPRRAGKSVKARAAQYIDQAGKPTPPPTPAKSASATERLRGYLADLDPLDAIRIGHESQPDLAPADLAALLRTYGVNVDAVQIALVLLGKPAEVTVEREDAGDTPDDADDAHHDAPQVGALPAVNKTQAIMDAAAHLGAGASAADIVKRVAHIHRITVDQPYVRTVVSREGKKARAAAAAKESKQVGQGGQGYA
ncbi:hypothetical protein OG530_19200 [Streptomyces decoyicus]|uniref:hypothetical protein n=1 Tax=Streptomyces decoyicus TaxID=249567 RepID=UPI002E17CFDC